MKQLSTFIFLIVTTLSGCTNHNFGDYRFQMDYPLQAARLSISGEVFAIVNCPDRKIYIISDSSSGILSRHVKSRLANICYNNEASFQVIYKFNPVRGPRQNMIATEKNRTLPVLNAYELR